MGKIIALIIVLFVIGFICYNLYLFGKAANKKDTPPKSFKKASVKDIEERINSLKKEIDILQEKLAKDMLDSSKELTDMQNELEKLNNLKLKYQ